MFVSRENVSGFLSPQAKQTLHGNEVSLKQGMTVIIIIFAIVIIITKILIAMVLFQVTM